MKKTTIIGAALLMAVFGIKTVKAQTCIKPPSCAELGYVYSEAECGETDILRCPTDLSKVYCNFNVNGKEGDILYADHSVSPLLLPNKAPIGIVLDAGNRLAISLDAQEFKRDGFKTFKWGENGDIPGLADCDGEKCNDSGISNTNAIISYAQKTGKSYPLAEAARAYAPSGCKQTWCGAGKWGLISMGEINKVMVQSTAIGEGFKTLGMNFAPSSIRSFLTSSSFNSGGFNTLLYVAGVKEYIPMGKRDLGDLSVLPEGWVMFAYRVIRY